jgi:hypothetical protein
METEKSVIKKTKAMTPKEKAKELISKFDALNFEFDNVHLLYHDSKKCALIAVEEILDGFRKILPSSRGYWNEVKQEIEKL